MYFIYTKIETICKIAITTGTINWSGGYNYFIYFPEISAL